MAQVTPRSILALQLPDPRFSVDFANYALDPKAYATTKKYMQDLFPGQNKPLPLPKAGSSRYCNVNAKPRRDMAKEPTPTSAASQTLDDKWDAHTIECMIMLEESLVGESDRSSSSSNLTAGSSKASFAANVTSASTLNSTTPTTKAANGSLESTRSFLQLPLAIVNHVLSYVFAEERAVSITPYQSRITPQPRRRHRHGPNTIDIRSFMMHPALMVCKQARELGLDILYRDSLFLVDLSDIGGANASGEKDIGKYWGCWTSSTPPHMVRSALARASNIRVQLPVPNAEATVVRSATKRKKDAQEETSIVIDSLRTVTTFITGQDKTHTQPTERSRSASPAGPKILRRKLSFRSAKRPDSLEFVCRGDSPPPQPREPLSILEVVLVKSCADAEVHSQTLDMVAICSSIPVSGALEYHLELDAMRRLWAKRDNGKWRGSEPDGHKLLHDLRALGRSTAKVVQPRDKTKLTYEQPAVRADVLRRAEVRTARHTTSDRPSLEGHPHQRGVPGTRPPKNGKVARKIKEMESLSKIKLLKGNKQPPTVEELQQIAADIRRGVY
ncbi:hypothetical protein BKA58DRAFT_205080 [Alternaria rosae]|uniref:uncharacterized protein n=1 Tax=Alternaria rosae TaxID=1187941 RepID=UPI001E8D6DFE|nr:uncharacterized protein BKA58DRAFT_205080 [Alternaria rosae]KAH6866460.1 hypothetical protein BKA58DRAFT_205080 [Alternaria rosae]